MGDSSHEDMDRLAFFEEAKKQAEQDYERNSKDIMAIIRWGGALLELAHFQQGPEAYQMIEEAAAKFKEALRINPRKHDALWCLGNAYTSQGFLSNDERTARSFFEKARDCFQKALQEDPNSEVYQKALEMTSKAPAMYAELQRQLAGGQMSLGGGGGGLSGGMGGGGAATSSKSDTWYEWGGWFMLGAILYGVFALARPPPGQLPAAK